jgi:ubiquinol-cytochrome c reductase cytochrome b subunit
MKVLSTVWHWIDDRTGLTGVLKTLMRHPVPPGTKWAYVFGSATLAAFLLQVVTGVILATVYVPSASEAYESLKYITNEAAFGNVLRGMHFFGASAMVVLVGIHMIRVYLTGSYKFPREMNWISGVVLLGLTLGMAFSGQLLRWDQNAIWSLVVGAEQAGRVPLIGESLGEFILGGRTIGGSTLSRFFAVHVFVLPGLIFAVVGFHLYLVIRNGISEPPRKEANVDPKTYRKEYETLVKESGVPFWPDAAWRDAVAGCLVVLVVLGLAVMIGPIEIGKPPDPTLLDAHPRPDWYFWWYFALLALLPHGLEDYVIVLGPLAVGLVLFLLPLMWGRGSRHPARRPWAVLIVLLAVTLIGALTVAGYQTNWSPRFHADPITAEIIGSSSGPVYRGGQLFNAKGCIYCHTIQGHGGKRGPDLTFVADRRTEEQMMIRILNGGYNMPAYAPSLSADEMADLMAFLQTRTRGDKESP